MALSYGGTRRALAIAAASVCLVTSANAQNAPAPAPAPPPAQAAPPGYAPPPPAYAYPPQYGYPPPPAYGYPPPQPYYPPPPQPYYPPLQQPYALPPPQAPPPRLIRRDGLTFGGALGGGAISATACPSCGGGFATDLHIGVMLHYRVALLADFSWIYRMYEAGNVRGRTVTLNNLLITGAAQAWVLNRLWLRFGVGRGTIHRTDWLGADSTASALAFSWGVGLELFQASTFALDLQYLGGIGLYQGGGAVNGAFLVGINWY